MKLKKDNGRDIIEVNERNVIINGIFKKKVIKRENILSACLREDLSGNKGLVILTKDYKVIERRKVNLRWEDREKLKLVIDEINNNDIIFNFKGNQDTALIIINMINCFVLATNTFAFNSFLKVIELFIYIIVMLLFIYALYRCYRFRGVLYDLTTKEFQVVGKKNKITRRFTLENLEILRKFKDGTFCLGVKNSKYKFNFKKGVVSYPISYDEALDEIKKGAEKNSHGGEEKLSEVEKR